MSEKQDMEAFMDMVPEPNVTDTIKATVVRRAPITDEEVGRATDAVLKNLKWVGSASLEVACERIARAALEAARGSDG